jgi:hypothetical protein
MNKWKNALVGCSAVAAMAMTSSLLATTGNFNNTTGSGLNNAFLSVDINGGIIASNNATTEGSNGPSGAPVVSPDPYGVLWSPWGGPTSTSGDNVQLPDSQASPVVTGSSITKTFGSVNATISEAGTAANYAQGGGGATLNSRDRGSPSGAAGDGDLFRDLLFAGANGNVQSTNYLQVSLTGLLPSTTYQVALYSYDSTGGHTTNWTATAPFATTTNDTHFGWNPDSASQLPAGYTFNAAGDFVAPHDEQSITWVAGTTPAPAIFTVTTDGTGAATLYGWGGNGISTDAANDNSGQNADTTYINGFQIALVPEPTSIGLLGFAAVGLLGRRRNKTA